VSIQGKPVIDRLDAFEKWGRTVPRLHLQDVAVTSGQLVIDFDYQVELPCIAAIVVEGSAATRKINCGGPAYKDYEADLQTCPTPPGTCRSAISTPTGLACTSPRGRPGHRQDLRADRRPPARADHLDRRTRRHPPRCPSLGAGRRGIRLCGRTDRVASADPRSGNLERFDYWLNGFIYLRTVAQLNCVWATFNER